MWFNVRRQDHQEDQSVCGMEAVTDSVRLLLVICNLSNLTTLVEPFSIKLTKYLHNDPAAWGVAFSLI